MRKTKIVCTIGPASETPEVLEQIVKAGMNVMRLNFSHGLYPEHLSKIEALRKINKKLGTSVAIMLDTKGPEIRTGDFGTDQKTAMSFKKGDKITLTTRKVEGTKDLLSISYEGLPNDVKIGGHILIDDGLVDLIIDEIDGTEIKCTFLNSATIKGRRGVNLPGAKLNIPSMTEKDKADLKFGFDNDCDYVAASFIRKAQDVLDIRNYLDSFGKNNIKIISKIENQEGLDNFDEILKVTDGVMVARGDLGVEIPEEQVPPIQKRMIKKTIAAGKPVITATQMLESMQVNPRATRAEVSDVANAVYDETSAVMLSGESAQGDYPVEAVKTMEKIVSNVEKDISYWKRFKRKNIEKLTSDENIGSDNDSNFAVCCSALFSNADAIISITEDGNDPAILSSYRTACPIFVLTTNEKTYRQMSVISNVKSVLIENEKCFDQILEKGINILKEQNYLKDNDTVVLSGGVNSDCLNKSILTTQATGTIIKI